MIEEARRLGQIRTGLGTRLLWGHFVIIIYHFKIFVSVLMIPENTMNESMFMVEAEDTEFQDGILDISIKSTVNFILYKSFSFNSSEIVKWLKFRFSGN